MARTPDVEKPPGGLKEPVERAEADGSVDDEADDGCADDEFGCAVENYRSSTSTYAALTSSGSRWWRSIRAARELPT